MFVTTVICVLAGSVYGETRNSTATPATFEADPKWDGFRNRRLPDPRPQVRQDFGYSRTNHAGGQAAGEIGGVVHRSQPRAYYAKAIPTLTFNDHFSASGKFAVTQAGDAGGAMIGWFHETSDGWRTPNSFVFRLDGNGGKYWVFYEYGTQNWATNGGGAFEGKRYQTTPTKPFPADGTVHEWVLTYDPDGGQGDGMMTVRIDGQEYQMPVSPGHKEDGIVLNRFGILNQQTPGTPLEFFLDDLVVNGQAFTFDEDPDWIGDGNRVTYQQRFMRPLHDIGFTRTNNAGSELGEIGGIMFRDEQPAYYAGRVGPFSLDDKLAASGKVALCSAGSDSGILLGWFSAQAKRNKKTPEEESRQTDYVGVLIEGPSRIGHYFRATYSTSQGSGNAPTGEGDEKEERPRIRPDKSVHEWSLKYNPDGAGGLGQIRVVFDDVVRDLALRPGERAEGALLDRFGFFNLQAGGHHVEIYVDDLRYSR
jgi:hypothetical protein